MKLFRRTDLEASNDFFRILATTEKTQVALMNLADGKTSGDYGTDHPQSDQVLLVLAGEGVVHCESAEVHVETGDVVLIPAGAKHQVVGTGNQVMRSISFYGPVAYPDEG